ncbi:TlpA family protein disulfide reductase [Chryseobacterium sp. cx-311]|uniref:TlpA family protein disulfide reductase n=1 Tax=Marnyiella aurantia TaxID=2758037 RepID=UPI001AE155C4|nr:TlpA disulfide reductase family protein [Marnyiella aurantia]MBP0612571.1 TlpA family protein disulfide reductase [Marnyiella aurantia]
MKFLRKNLIFIILLAVAGIAVAVPNVRNYIQEQFIPVATVQEAVTVDDADYDVKLKGINTTSTNLKNFKGKKLVFLNFWGTWCKPCREEWPSIQKLYDSKKDDMDFVLIAMMDKEEDVRKFLQENNYTVPVYIAESPINGKILPKVFPTTFILDSNGRILQRETATKDWNTEAVHSFIDKFIPAKK